VVAVSDDISEWANEVHEGDCRDVLSEMPESSVHMCMTSPPYYGLRDYGVEEQIGLEDTLDGYIQELVEVGREIRRVLRDDGSWWLNLGDSYAGSGRGQWEGNDGQPKESYTPGSDELPDRSGELERKNKMLVPHRVAIALQEDGWVVRNDVTWVKPNPMPSSVKDRLNTTTEQIFHLTPEPDYWYDLDAIREPHQENTKARAERGVDSGNKLENGAAGQSEHTLHQPDEEQGGLHPGGKNPGDVFEVTTKPYPDAHFAVYPPELCEKPIKATCPPKVCADCGAPYERKRLESDIPEPNTSRKQGRRALEKYRHSDLTADHLRALRAVGFTDAGQAQEVYDGFGNNTEEVEKLAEEAKDVLGGYAREFLGDNVVDTEWVKPCDCDTDGTKAGIALDPFAGAGTTCMVAKRERRRFVGIDLNGEYCEMAREREMEEQTGKICDGQRQATLDALAQTDGGGRGE
jgi:DNA modification methylase